MAKMTIYLPNRLHRQVLDQALPVSKICQAALGEALDASRVSTGARLRRLAASLEAVSEQADARILIAIERIKNAGLDPQQVLGDLPFPTLLIARARELGQQTY